MIITNIIGGLGNQLFQYAMGRRLAARHHTELLLDVTSFGVNGVETRPEALQAFNRRFQLSHFRTTARLATSEEIALLKDDYWRATTRDRLVRRLRKIVPMWRWKPSHIREGGYRFNPAMLELPDGVFLQGFWQGEKYFADVAETIRAEFQLRDETITVRARDLVERLRARHGCVVAVQVRRGDNAYAHEVLGKTKITTSAPVGTSYLKTAMRRFGDDACFLVFSDTPADIEWCRRNIQGRNVEYSDAQSDLLDFTAMSQCDHNIIGNSTFGWWAAWLNQRPGRKVIAPSRWSPPDHPSIITEDLLPKDWTALDPDSGKAK